ncbi:MAG: hypothetical protein MUE72_02815 [Chitinophagaceae bacterium]|jgi:hypothetical protein|nr:hypothetical protein [Chitinophagaceae bacterium]
MDNINLLKQTADNISGIWANKKYELILGLNNVFTFEEKESREIKDGTYSVIQDSKYHYPVLKLTELNGINHYYVINELTIFETLTISNEVEIIHFKNVSPDEYDGDIFDPANN